MFLHAMIAPITVVTASASPNSSMYQSVCPVFVVKA
jgi:hypothetical protein